jgi:hypothetical protein
MSNLDVGWAYSSKGNPMVKKSGYSFLGKIRPFFKMRSLNNPAQLSQKTSQALCFPAGMLG